MSRDRILLQGLRFYGYHGVNPEETRLGQRFVVDLELGVDTRAAGQSDDLTRTVNYGAVYDDVRAVVEGRPYKLIEAVAEAVAARVLERYPVRDVLVRVRKPEAPIPAQMDWVAVEIYRERAGATEA